MARAYVDTLKKWEPREFSVWVGINDSKETLVFFKGDIGYRDASVHLEYDEQVQKRLETSINQAISWAAIARENGADTQKGLECFGYDPYGTCKKYSSTSSSNQVAFGFFSSNGGKQTDLTIELSDRDNRYRNDTFYFDLPSIKKIKVVVEAIPEKILVVEKKFRDSEKLFTKSDRIPKQKADKNDTVKKILEELNRIGKVDN